jgi:uncharacterized delta-60 repeat protein
MLTLHRRSRFFASTLLVLIALLKANALKAGNDYARGVAVDNPENIFVTGSSEGFGTALDYATLKYDTSGALRWKMRYNGPGFRNDDVHAITTDNWGNVFVTGGSVGSGSGSDYATIKYNSDGATKWVARFNGSANSDDNANSVAVDSWGNVCVTGGSRAAGGSLDIVTIKYSSSGSQQWAVRWAGPFGDDIGRVVQFDAWGNVYVTGSTTGAGSRLDYITLKYNANGALLWSTQYNGPGNGEDIPTALAVDSSGNAFITGSSFGGGSGLDFATIKYNSSGAQQWVARFNGPANWNDKPSAVALDPAGNVFVTGSATAFGGAMDYTTLKYNGNGSLLWRATYNGPANADDIATALAVDNGGNAYITGRSLGWGSAQDYATIKYNNNGQQQWVTRYNGDANGDDTAVGIGVNNASGNVYVTGSSLGFGTVADFATVKYNNNGQQQWVARFNGP